MALGDVCDVIDPNPSHRYPYYVTDGVPIISSSEFIGEDGIDASRAQRVPMSFYLQTLGRFNVGEGDVVFSRKGKIGYARSHPAGETLSMTHTLCVLKPDRTRLDSRYLLHFARSPMFLQELTGTMNPNVGVPTLGLAVIRAASLPFPTIEKQKAIAAELDAYGAATSHVQQLQSATATDLQNLLPSILEKFFRINEFDSSQEK